MGDMLQNVKRGDRNAFHDFYFAYHARLYYYVIKFTRSTWLAEETVQLSFVKLWETRENLSSSHSLSSQLFRIAKSTLIDLLRKNSIRETECISHDIDIYSITGTEELTRTETKDELQHAMNIIKQMPPVQQQVFSYSRIHNFSHKEIAEKLSISTKTVETHITRAIKQLKKAVPLIFYIICYSHFL